jgi:hypothetical protein
MGTKIPDTNLFSLAENHIHADWVLFILDINSPPPALDVTRKRGSFEWLNGNG